MAAKLAAGSNTVSSASHTVPPIALVESTSHLARWNDYIARGLMMAERGLPAGANAGARCSETSSFAPGAATMTPSRPLLREPSIGSIAPPGRSSAARPMRPMRSRNRSSRRGSTSLPCVTRTDSTHGSIACWSTPAIGWRSGRLAARSWRSPWPFPMPQAPEMSRTSWRRAISFERAFRRLTPEQRAALVVHHFLGLPDAEAASVLEIAVGTFKSRLHRASIAMRAAVEADERVSTAVKESIA